MAAENPGMGSGGFDPNNPNRVEITRPFTGSGAAVASTKPTAPAMTPEEIAQKFGYSWAVISSDPALLKWFNDFARRYVESGGTITQEAFQLELEQQPWWKEHSATWIADFQLETNDPVTWNQNLDSRVANIQTYANSIGATLTPEQARQLAINAGRFGWNEQQQRNAVGAYVVAVYSDGRLDFAGTSGVMQDDLQAWADRNGVPVSENMLAQYVQQAAMGTTTLDEIKSDLRRTYMAGAFPAWADRIQAGFDIADIAAPYRSTMAQLLEINPDQITWNDPLFKAGLQSVGADGKPRVMPLYEYEQMIRRDSRWQTTDNAYATYANVANNVLATWGFR